MIMINKLSQSSYYLPLTMYPQIVTPLFPLLEGYQVPFCLPHYFDYFVVIGNFLMVNYQAHSSLILFLLSPYWSCYFRNFVTSHHNCHFDFLKSYPFLIFFSPYSSVHPLLPSILHLHQLLHSFYLSSMLDKNTCKLVSEYQLLEYNHIQAFIQHDFNHLHI